MSSTSTSARFAPRRLLARIGFPGLLATTLVLVAATILLGVAAKATGSGLACEANWPQCDAGPYDLFPAHLPSFYEWFHRFVAMFAGFAIVGTALSAWRSSSVDRRVTWLVVGGMVLTPIQVYLGRETVTQYTMDILSLHFWTAILIFAMFVVATVLVWESRLRGSHVTGALALGILALPFHVALSPALGLATDVMDPATVQFLQYAVTLALIALVIVAVMVGRWRYSDTVLFGVLGASTGLTLAVTYLGREVVMNYSPLLDDLYVVLALALAVAFGAGIYRSRRV